MKRSLKFVHVTYDTCAFPAFGLLHSCAFGSAYMSPLSFCSHSASIHQTTGFFTKGVINRCDGRFRLRSFLPKVYTYSTCVQISASTIACLSETPKNTTGIHMLFRDPKTRNKLSDEPCACLSKNTHALVLCLGFSV